MMAPVTGDGCSRWITAKAASGVCGAEGDGFMGLMAHGELADRSLGVAWAARVLVRGRCAGFAVFCVLGAGGAG